jgi:hypothetical protein
MELGPQTNPASRPDARGLGILARSLFRQMRHEGYTPEQIVALSTELLQLVREDMAQQLPAQ